jgi:hypothetical protein
LVFARIVQKELACFRMFPFSVVYYVPLTRSPLILDPRSIIHVLIGSLSTRVSSSFLFKFRNAVTVELKNPLDAEVTRTAHVEDITKNIHRQAS